MSANNQELELKILYESEAKYREYAKHMITVNVTFMSFVLVASGLIFTIASRDAVLTIYAITIALIVIILPFGLLCISLGYFIILFMPPRMIFELEPDTIAKHSKEQYVKLTKYRTRSSAIFMGGVVGSIGYFIILLGFIVSFYL